MKKVLCVLLSLLMAFSVATVAFAAEGEDESSLIENLSGLLASDDFVNAFDGKNLTMPASLNNYKVGGGYDMTRIINDGKLNGVYFLGMDLGFLYSTESVLDWGRLSVSHNDVANLYGEIDQFLGTHIRLGFRNDMDLFTAKNATLFVNLIGRMFFPNFQNKNITFETAVVTEKRFYTTVADESGLSALIDRVWCKDPSVNFLPFVRNVIGVDLSNYDAFDYFTVPSDPGRYGNELAPYMIKSVVEGAFESNPITYFLTALQRLLSTYSFNMYEAVRALLSEKIKAGIVTEDQLHNFQTLFNTLANSNGRESGHVEYIPVPAYRYTTARDNTEMFLYLLIYLNLLGKHKNNATVMNNFKNKCAARIGDKSDKQIVIAIFDALFFSDLSGLVRLMPTLVERNLSTVSMNLSNMFRNFAVHLIRAITSFFDGIFQTFKNGINLDNLKI